MVDIDTQDQFDALTDAEKVQVLGDALIEANEALTERAQQVYELMDINAALQKIIKEAMQDV